MINELMAANLILTTANFQDGWAYEQALRYQRTGEIGPDLRPYVEWWHSERDDLPAVSLGSMNCWYDIEDGLFDPSRRA